MRASLLIQPFTSGIFAANSFVLHSSGKLDAIVIDPAMSTTSILTYLSRHQLKVSAILLTHGHIDHVYTAASLMKQTQADLWMHPADAYLIDDLPFWADYFKLAPPEPIEIWQPLTDGQTFHLGKHCELRTIATPGHTPGSVCFKIADHLWTGDTLFCGSIGRTDLPGGDWAALEHSLAQLMQFPPPTLCHPGHGPDTSIAAELLTNPFVKSHQI